MIIIIVVAALATVFLLLLAFAALCNKIAFGRRCDKNPYLKYFTAKDFGLSADEFPLENLYGVIYEKKGVTPKDEIIIFVHGMGPGHCAYTTEIAYFCNLGYTVIAVDSLGCELSSGKSIRGMYEGVKSAVKTVDFAKKQFAGQKIILVGHSWGGYSALCASKLRKVDKVVAISAPLTPSKTVKSGAAAVVGKVFAATLRPFLAIANFLKFGANGNMNAAKCAEKNGTPTLLIHGGKDRVVPENNAAFYHANGEKIEKYFAAEKAHNPYNTVEAEKKLYELSHDISRMKAATDGEKTEYFSKFDFKAATEEDLTVMEVIKNFLEK